MPSIVVHGRPDRPASGLRRVADVVHRGPNGSCGHGIPAIIEGAGHSLHSTGMAAAAIGFFGLNTPPSPPPSSPPPSSPPPKGACTAAYRQINTWPGGFQGEVAVRAGTSAINGWTVRMTFPSGVTVSQVWNGTLSGSAPACTVKNAPWNGGLGPMAPPRTASSATAAQPHRRTPVPVHKPPTQCRPCPQGRHSASRYRPSGSARNVGPVIGVDFVLRSPFRVRGWCS